MIDQQYQQIMRKTQDNQNSKQQINQLRETLKDILSTKCSNKIKLNMLEGFCENIKLQIFQFNEGLRKDEILSTSFSDCSNGSQEQQLFEELDSLEQKILQARQKKIQLHFLIEKYQDQLYEYQQIYKLKQSMNQKLKNDLKNKRKQLELQKSKELNSQNSLISRSFENVSSFIIQPFKTFWK